MSKPKRQQKALQKQSGEATEREAYRRRMNTRFLFWTVCSDGRCKRAKRCVGDGEACFQRWWPHVPEECKQELRAVIDGLRRGLTPAEAVREVESKLAAWKEVDAAAARATEEQNAKAAVRGPVNAPKGEPVTGPRVRSL